MVRKNIPIIESWKNIFDRAKFPVIIHDYEFTYSMIAKKETDKNESIVNISLYVPEKTPEQKKKFVDDWMRTKGLTLTRARQQVNKELKKHKQCIRLSKKNTEPFLSIDYIIFFVNYAQCFPNALRASNAFRDCIGLAKRIAKDNNINCLVLEDHSYINIDTTKQEWLMHTEAKMLTDVVHHPIFRKVLQSLSSGITYYGQFGFHLLPHVLFTAASKTVANMYPPEMIIFFKNLDNALSATIHNLANKYSIMELYDRQCKSKQKMFTRQSLESQDSFREFLQSNGLSEHSSISDTAKYIEKSVKHAEKRESARILYDILSLCLFITPEYVNTKKEKRQTENAKYMNLVYRFLGTRHIDWTDIDTINIVPPDDLNLSDLATLILGVSTIHTRSVCFI